MSGWKDKLGNRNALLWQGAIKKRVCIILPTNKGSWKTGCRVTLSKDEKLSVNSREKESIKQDRELKTRSLCTGLVLSEKHYLRAKWRIQVHSERALYKMPLSIIKRKDTESFFKHWRKKHANEDCVSGSHVYKCHVCKTSLKKYFPTLLVAAPLAAMLRAERTPGSPGAG